MAFFPDLCHECEVDQGRHVRAVGWLGAGHRFPTGTTPPGFLPALREHVATAWQPIVAAGVHECELCAPGSGSVGAGNVWMPSGQVVYVAPELIVHYVGAHGYRPPEEFIAAVLTCPRQGSAEYRARMRRFPAWWRDWLDREQ